MVVYCSVQFYEVRFSVYFIKFVIGVVIAGMQIKWAYILHQNSDEVQLFTVMSFFIFEENKIPYFLPQNIAINILPALQYKLIEIMSDCFHSYSTMLSCAVPVEYMSTNEISCIFVCYDIKSWLIHCPVYFIMLC